MGSDGHRFPFTREDEPMILPFELAKRVTRDKNTLIYLPADRAWTPKTGRIDRVQSRDGRKLRAHGRITVGMWEKTTLRPLLEPDALKTRQAAGWRVGDGIVCMCDDWMRRYDTGYPKVDHYPCLPCDQTGVRCDECAGEGWLYRERRYTPEQIRDRFTQRYADRAVYAVIVSPNHIEEARFLSHAGRPRGDELGYTDNPASAMQDAGQAVPVAYQEQLSKQARERDEELRKELGVGRDMRSRKRQQDRYKRAA